VKSFLKILFIVVVVALVLFVAFFIFKSPSVSEIKKIGEGNSIFPTIVKKLEEKPIRIIFTGDVMLSRSVGNRMARENNFSYPFEKIKDFFTNADVVAINLEGPVSLRGENMGSEYSFRADPRVLKGLQSIHVNVASLANNHMWDWGSVALLDTVSFLQKDSILPVGAGKNFAEANKVKALEIRGTKIGFLAFQDLYPKNLLATETTPGVSSFDAEKTAAQIKKIKQDKEVDFLVILFHWGEEYKPLANERQKMIAHSLVDAGADLIIGNHPHVTQNREEYKGVPIFYSLGNFVFDQYFSAETMQGEVAEISLQNNKISEIRTYTSFLNKTYQIEKIIQN
jgi:poly-gamma-glutamate synthesis protein (capsule biosynthesis protein)